MGTNYLTADLADGRQVRIAQPPGAPGDKEWNFAYHSRGEQFFSADRTYDLALADIVTCVEKFEGSRVVGINGQSWPSPPTDARR